MSSGSPAPRSRSCGRSPMPCGARRRSPRAAARSTCCRATRRRPPGWWSCSTPRRRPDEDALAVLAVRGDTDLSRGAPALVARRRSGGGALAIVIGDDDERADLERRLLRGHRLEMSNIAHVPSLEGATGAEAAIDAILPLPRRRGHRRRAGATPACGTPIGRRPHAPRSAAVGRDRRAALAGRRHARASRSSRSAWSPSSPPSTDRPFGAERALEALAIFGAGFGWRAIGRSAAGLHPRRRLGRAGRRRLRRHARPRRGRPRPPAGRSRPRRGRAHRQGAPPVRSRRRPLAPLTPVHPSRSTP